MSIDSFIETERLILRPFAQSDKTRLVEIFSDPQVAKWVGDGEPLSSDDAQNWINATHISVKTNGTSAGAIVEKQTKCVIGWGGIVHPQNSLPEIIYGFETASWGNGYGREIATAIIQNGIQEHNFASILATIDPKNLASAKILKSLNFQLIDSGVDEHGLPTDTYLLTQESNN